MGNNNFVGGKLFNLKDKISNPQNKQGLSQNNKSDSQEPPPKILQEKTIVENLPKVNNTQEESNLPEIVAKSESSNSYDKSYQQALLNKKDDFIRTKQVVIKAIAESAQTIFKRKEEIEKDKNACNDVLATIEKLSLKISSIDESKWKDEELAIALMEANKSVENARIENILMQEKIKELIKVETKAESLPTHNSMIEMLSLTYKQLFKFSIGFFGPVILSIILGAIIIALAILGAMGAL